VIVHPLEMHCLDAAGKDLGPVPTSLTYDADDPLAIVLAMNPNGRTNRWRFSRDLITDGRHKLTGLGDVSVWPFDDKVCIRLANQQGEAATLTTDLSELNAFVSDMRRLVPDGAERVDIDALVASLLAGA
jgi:hypothetical protein